jgi:hypothetical protein
MKREYSVVVPVYPFVQFMQNVCSLLSGFMINYALPISDENQREGGERLYASTEAKLLVPYWGIQSTLS